VDVAGVALVDCFCSPTSTCPWLRVRPVFGVEAFQVGSPSVPVDHAVAVTGKHFWVARGPGVSSRVHLR